MTSPTFSDLLSDAITPGTDLYAAVERLVGCDTSDPSEMAVGLQGVRRVLGPRRDIAPLDIVREVLDVDSDGTYQWAAICRGEADL